MTDYFGYTKWQLTGFVSVLIFLYLLWGYILPKVNYTLGVYNSLQQQEQKIVSAQNWENNLAELNQKYTNLSDYFSNIFVSIPENDQMSTIIEELYKQAEAASVKLEQMRPKERLEHSIYDELPVHVKIKGDYHQLGKFMNRIEYSKYLMKIEEVSIQAPGNPEKSLSAQILLKVVILEGNSEQGEETDA